MKPNIDLLVCAKIEVLFKSRRLPDQGNQLIPCQIQSLLPKLTELQSAIYSLDKYFERTWDLEPEYLTILWSRILRTLGETVTRNQNLEELVGDIRAYQRLEESIRSPFLRPLPRLLDYYHLKTCDVRLARQIITDHSLLAASERKQYLHTWELFDLASEACDDLEDIDEDLSTFNGNRFLLGVGAVGVAATIKAYGEFESLLTERTAYSRTRRHSKPSLIVLNWACDRLITLRALLQARSATVETIVNRYSRSKLRTYRATSTRLTAGDLALGQFPQSLENRLLSPSFPPVPNISRLP